MTYRTISTITSSEELQVGPLRVKQPLPTPELQQVSPFVLLHHAGPTFHEAGKGRTRLNPHPHRGFEPVTFLFSGGLHHKDSLGNEGFLEAGDVQWMTAGSGILHSEGPSAAFSKQGGNLELVQLWVNLPRAHKMTAPKYQDIKKQQIPVVEQGGFRFSVVAGSFAGQQGPAGTFTPILATMVSFPNEAKTTIPLPASHNALLYVLEGEIETNGTVIKSQHLGVYNLDGEAVELVAKAAGKALFLSGAPINEPLATYGPFVMNYIGDIKQAILDYETGKMGVLES